MSATERDILKEHTGHILVADDEGINRELLRDLLEQEGHHVTEAEDGQRALEAVADSRPDVVLLDVVMPQLDGFEVCRRIKADPESSSTPVLLVTVLSERKERLAGIEAGANDFLSKPIDSREVVLRVRNSVYTKHLFDQVERNYRRLRDLEALCDSLTSMIDSLVKTRFEEVPAI